MPSKGKPAGSRGPSGAVAVSDPERAIVRRPIADLLLDPQNPRILIAERAPQLDILRALYQHEALGELAHSFARNGYFPEEPVVLVPSSSEPKKYVVVEGNRRVATIKLLLDPRLRETLKVADFPELPADRRKELESIPSVLYPTREEIVPYLGFRHITGVKTWEPYFKARYISRLLDQGLTLEQIEQSIGDDASTVKKLYQSFVVFQQVQRDLDMDVKDLRDRFSLLEVMLGQAAIKQFLSVPRRLPTAKLDEIVSTEAMPRLREAISWVFGDSKRGEAAVISDSRQISSRLGPILLKPEAVEWLRQTRNLEQAYERSDGERALLIRRLSQIRRVSQEAVGLLPAYRSDAEIAALLADLVPVLDALLERKVQS